MLTWNHFVAASDGTLRQMARDVGKANQCQVKIDFILALRYVCQSGEGAGNA